MESVIYKYALDFDGNGGASIVVPDHSTLLKVGVQQDKIVVWYKLCFPRHHAYAGQYIEKFKVTMTGEHFDDDSLEYVDTVTIKDWIVCHVFMVI
ncbi:hypothetical protein M0R04_16260 [Candidatus Dojkabacteria bacterium]|jgi:hypothetical protein|nr:hypothetical protein [Candidatus Dojkabacteria bacterium]